MDGGKRNPNANNRRRTNSSGRPVNRHKRRSSGSRLPSRLRALILAVIALIVIIFVVLIAAGAFGGKQENKTAEETTTAVENETETTDGETGTDETTTAETTEATTEPTTEEETTASDARTVYFSFNIDSAYDTTAILDALDKNGVKATFFVDCREEDNSKVKDIYEKGHSVGVLQHDDDTANIYKDVEAFKNDINAARQALFHVTGQLSDIYRFPNGSANEEVRDILEDCKAYIKELGMVYYDWNIDSYADTGAGADAIAWNIENQIDSNTFKTNVVLIKDDASADDIAAALETVIPSLKEKGFVFAGLNAKTPEMTFDIQ